ncbi:trehalose-phosphatase [Aeromicrobium sp. 50.2.37]|uniref:trehalose-phosphatase n=1 Tax=Aeromicrobium sp. 50.2.37 TaxID=2969305 RepID=UPI0021502435|nr:trehalose-phosphatase [Aeromicrobium sp. 50.2.37]MCR4513832.1 trehalose-phosphatase [Aeromicrobium sp. 50.2.37]
MPAADHPTPDVPASLLVDPRQILLGLDFDGTLAHVVDDPTRAFAHPDAVTAVARLGHVLGQVAIVTGRPVDQALTLSGFRGLPGLERLVICGQYGAERWDAEDDVLERPDRPDSVERLAAMLPRWLADHDAGHVRIEDKGLAVAIHTRGIDADLIHELDGPLRALAADLDLEVEPGRQVLELRGHATDKGVALRDLVESTGLRRVVYVGDDLGDLPAFEAVEHLRHSGGDGVLVASASGEQDALVSRSDVVLPGPDGVAAWLTAWADALDG